MAHQLAQLRPDGTTAVSLFSPDENRRYHIELVNVCNVSAAATNITIYHDEDGSTYDETTALVWNYVLGIGEVFQFESQLTGDLKAGNLAVKTSVADAANFTAYGNEEGQQR